MNRNDPQNFRAYSCVLTVCTPSAPKHIILCSVSKPTVLRVVVISTAHREYEAIACAWSKSILLVFCSLNFTSAAPLCVNLSATVARHIGGRLPPGWGAVWEEKGCGELAGTPADQFQVVVTYLRVMEIRCVRCPVRLAGSCRQCHLGWCTHCQQESEECDVCRVPITLTTTTEVGGAKSYAQRLQTKGMNRDATVSVNMHEYMKV